MCVCVCVVTGLCVVWMCGVVDVVSGGENVSGRECHEGLYVLFCFVGAFFLWVSVLCFAFFVAPFVPGFRLFVVCVCVVFCLHGLFCLCFFWEFYFVCHNVECVLLFILLGPRISSYAPRFHPITFLCAPHSPPHKHTTSI